jgi:hypothetical protein
MLLGFRKEKRKGEGIVKELMQATSFAFIGGLKKYRAVEVSDVAKTMVWAAKKAKPGFKTYEYDEMMMVKIANK